MKHIKNHKGKITAVLIVITVLIVAYFSDGVPENGKKNDVTVAEQNSDMPQSNGNEIIQAEETEVIENDVTRQAEPDENQVPAKKKE